MTQQPWKPASGGFAQTPEIITREGGRPVAVATFRTEKHRDLAITCVNALSGISNEQIERDAKLYPHVADMHLAITEIARHHDGEAQKVAMACLAEIGDDQ